MAWKHTGCEFCWFDGNFEIEYCPKKDEDLEWVDDDEEL